MRNVSGATSGGQQNGLFATFQLSDNLFIAYEKFFLTATEVKRNGTSEIWSFSTAIFFAVTSLTTIGS